MKEITIHTDATKFKGYNNYGQKLPKKDTISYALDFSILKGIKLTSKDPKPPFYNLRHFTTSAYKYTSTKRTTTSKIDCISEVKLLSCEIPIWGSLSLSLSRITFLILWVQVYCITYQVLRTVVCRRGTLIQTG